MPRSPQQKLKLLYILKYLREESDKRHRLKAGELISRLKEVGISAERKSIYADIDELKRFGIDIVSDCGYYIASSGFEPAELKLLADSVQASRFITERKSRSLIKKIEGLTNKYNAQSLHRQVFATERLKAANEDIYCNVDYLMIAIDSRKKAEFFYFEYTSDKSRRLRNGGQKYVVSPYSLVWAEENYYLLSHYQKRNGLTHFRVDRMKEIQITDEPADDINAVMGENFDLTDYSKKLFNMFGGETMRVTVEADEKLINAVIDRFGESVYLRNSGNGKFIFSVDVKVSPTFFGWLFMFGSGMKILSPDTLFEEYKSFLHEVLCNYAE